MVGKRSHLRKYVWGEYNRGINETRRDGQTRYLRLQPIMEYRLIWEI